MIPEYLLLGHVTRDVLPNGATAPGGTSVYAAVTAHRLGQRVAVVSAPAAFPDEWPAGIAVAFTAATTPPVFENRYTKGQRTQLLHAVSTPLSLDDIPEIWRNVPIVHLGPVLREVPEALVSAFPGSLIGVTPQGWMRAWETPLPAPVRYAPWQPAPELLQRIDALVLSIEDVQGDEALVAGYAKHCPLVALTRGDRGATLFLAGEPTTIPAFPAIERDPTGAGDVFAATLFCELRAGMEPVRAAERAAQVAAKSVEVVGANGIIHMALADENK